MKHYEILFILKPTLTDDEIQTKANFVAEVINKNGGQIASQIDMGTRKLAYKIDKYERGAYKVFYFQAPTNLIEELVRNVRITEDIIRFLIVKYETKSEILAWEKLSKGQKLAQIKKSESRAPRANKENTSVDENAQTTTQEQKE